MKNIHKYFLINLIFINTSSAFNIFYESTNFTSQINHFSPVGQTFIVNNQDTLFFGFDYSDCNSFLGDATISFTLFEGEGIVGSMLLQDSFAASTLTGGINYFDISSIVFTSGNTYTVQVASTIARGCYKENVLFVASPGPDYPDGHEVYQGTINAQRDMVFHLLDDAVDLSVVGTFPSEVLEGITFDVSVQIDNLIGSTSTNTDVVFDTDFNIVSTSGCLNDPNGFPNCTLNNLDAVQSASVVVTLNSQVSPGLKFFGASVANDTFEIETNNNDVSANINVLSEVLFNNGFE